MAASARSPERSKINKLRSNSLGRMASKFKLLQNLIITVAANARRNGRAKFSPPVAGRVFECGPYGKRFEARGRIAAWRKVWNEERARSSLIYRTPEEFARGIVGEKEFEESATGKSKN